MRIVFVFVLLCLTLVGCVGADRLETTRFTVEPAGAERIDAELHLSRGNLTLSGTGDAVFDGEFVYQISDYTPHFDYEVENAHGYLMVEQPSVAAEEEDGSEYVTTVSLSNALPYELHLHKTSGFGDIDLTGMNLLAFDANLGQSTSYINFGGDHPRLARVTIESGEGEDSVLMDGVYPSLTEMTFALDTVSDEIRLDGVFDALTTLEFQMGGGSDNISVGGTFSRIVNLTINTFDGDDVVDLSGTFSMLQSASIQTGRGSDQILLTGDWPDETIISLFSREDLVSVTVPEGVGLEIEVSSPSIVVSGDGLTTEGSTITNALFGTAERTLRLNFNTSDGEVTSVFEIVTVTTD